MVGEYKHGQALLLALGTSHTQQQYNQLRECICHHKLRHICQRCILCRLVNPHNQNSPSTVDHIVLGVQQLHKSLWCCTADRWDQGTENFLSMVCHSLQCTGP
eukprot:TRINITY_DN49024_c0_g1_i1.p2 TRINITY_DN49024_c0_g1~~TRINITY_DN49024_c0_g1_i1.p2  ORF type:complete len:103 (-),score=7.84 TRINITY_DN49024_c0_g1_i1:318-626(-)